MTPKTNHSKNKDIYHDRVRRRILLKKARICSSNETNVKTIDQPCPPLWRMESKYVRISFQTFTLSRREFIKQLLMRCA